MTDEDNDEQITEVREDVATIKETLKWHKWLLVVLIAATVSPKLGGPSAPELVSQAFPFLPGA